MIKQGIAILYQAKPPPPKDGIQKPMKPTGYADSGADIAFALKERGYRIITPVETPNEQLDRDWVFPDTIEGIQQALDRGVEILWLNTILYDAHPINAFFDKGLEFVGQTPEMADLYDDKLLTNELLAKHALPIPEIAVLDHHNLADPYPPISMPAVLKPIRGRGSQGVIVVEEHEKLLKELRNHLASKIYGDSVYLEPFLPGQEITLSVMPPGMYHLKGKERKMDHHWGLPAVKRFNHHNGVAPYNGTVAVMHNSAVLDDLELAQNDIIKVSKQCEQAAALVGARAPIRVDCRADAAGDYFLFDLNVKPNMTGASRAHRRDQDSLTALAARKIGWSFADMLENMLRQKWKR